jgi:hypothetical protein
MAHKHNNEGIQIQNLKHTKDCRQHALRTHNQIHIQNNTFAGKQKLIADENFYKTL